MEGAQDTVSSLLRPGKDYAWADIRRNVEVEIVSLDDYCRSTGVAHIDILKSDTQGFDLEVLQGATGLLQKHRIHLIFIELNFIELYVDMAKFEDIYGFLKNSGFELVSFYNLSWHNSRLGWLDGLFINPLWKPT